MASLSDYFVLVDGPKKYRGQNLQTGTSYELVLSDAGKVVEMNNASANTCNIPANASVAFPVDTRIDVYQRGASGPRRCCGPNEAGTRADSGCFSEGSVGGLP